jgi:hypothetical protein
VLCYHQYRLCTASPASTAGRPNCGTSAAACGCSDCRRTASAGDAWNGAALYADAARRTRWLPARRRNRSSPAAASVRPACRGRFIRATRSRSTAIALLPLRWSLRRLSPTRQPIRRCLRASVRRLCRLARLLLVHCRRRLMAGCRLRSMALPGISTARSSMMARSSACRRVKPINLPACWRPGKRSPCKDGLSTRHTDGWWTPRPSVLPGAVPIAPPPPPPRR